MKQNRAFTLIELLLVTGTISLLMSVIFFKVTEAKRKAEDAHMVAETSQVSRAVTQYKNDNGGRVPGYSMATGEGSLTILETEDGDYNEALQPLVSGGYMPSIPYSPSGDDYAYVISADGMSAVFAADLNYPRNTSAYNSCPLVTEDVSGGSGSCNPVTIPAPSVVTFYLYKIPLPAQGGPTGSCSTGNLSSLYGPPNYSCIDNNASTRSSCTCSNGTATSNNPSSVPHDACDAMYDNDCSVFTTSQPYSYFKAFAWTNSNYQDYLTYQTNLAAYLIEYEEAVAEYNACVAQSQDTICDGSTNNDYCQCL